MIADAEDADEEADGLACARALLERIARLTGIPVAMFTAAAHGRFLDQGGAVPEEAESVELLREFERISSREHRRILIAFARFCAQSAA